MQITVVRTGGFAGVHELLGPVDTDNTDSELGTRIRAAAEDLHFFRLPESLPAGRIIDGFNYLITIVAAENNHSVRFDDGSPGSEASKLRELIDLLEEAGAGFVDNVASETQSDTHVDIHDWAAWYNRMPGTTDPDLHVSGTCSIGGSTMLFLRPGNEGIVDEPDLFVLELVIHANGPEGNSRADRVISWHGDVGSNITRVRINGADVPELAVTEAV